MTYLAYFRIKHVILVENVALKRAVGVRNDESLKAGKGKRFKKSKKVQNHVFSRFITKVMMRKKITFSIFKTCGSKVA